MKLYFVTITGRERCIYRNIEGKTQRMEQVYAKSHKEAKDTVWNNFLNNEDAWMNLDRRYYKIESEDVTELENEDAWVIFENGQFVR